MKRIFREEKGTNILEFALILPLFLLLILGVFDFGNGYNTYIGLSNATREGAFWLSRYPADRVGMVLRINEEVERVGLSVTDVTITLTPDKVIYQPGESVTVSLHHNYSMMFGAFTEFATIDLRTQATAGILN